MANIFDLNVDVILHIFRFLLIEDRIAFAFTCQRLRQLCIRDGVFKKMDLSRLAISSMQRGEINKFFRDRQLTQHIRELNISNLRALNWQLDDHLEEFIMLICPHLEALHVLNCGMSLQRLHHILRQAPKLTALSWSLADFTSEDIEFLVKCIESSGVICLKNIKHLHLEILRSKSHIQIAKYLLLSCFRDLEELEIYIWWIHKAYCTQWSFPFPVDDFIPGFPHPSVKNKLYHLHSLMVVAVGGTQFEIYNSTYREELSDFVISVLRRKSSSTKWKKLWILPSIGISASHLTDLSLLLHQDDFQSVEEIGAHAHWSFDAGDETKTFFERIGDNTVRSLHLCLPSFRNSIVEFCEPILRIGGHSLKFLRLSSFLLDRICAEENVFIHSFFSICLNIVELDLLECSFEKDICKPLSELKHLMKVQLMECAISSKYNTDQVELSNANLVTFVENCKNITHLDVRGCEGYHMNFSCRLTNSDLLTLAKLRNLKSLTLYEIIGITECTFLQNISEHCKFLTVLRIFVTEHFNKSHIPLLMESSRFLKHLALDVQDLDIGSESFWNLLSHAKNLQRLCIRCGYMGLLNIPVAVETLKSLPQLHVLHLHSRSIENVEDFHNQIIRILEEKESDSRFSFEIVVGNSHDMSQHSMISNRVLPLNLVELCLMIPILDIPRS